MSDNVLDNASAHQYELMVDGHLARIVYEDNGNTRTFLHTIVPPELGGRGVGSQIVKAALDDVRSSGRKLVPQCKFTKAYIDKHPDYADLVVAP